MIGVTLLFSYSTKISRVEMEKYQEGNITRYHSSQPIHSYLRVMKHILTSIFILTDKILIHILTLLTPESVCA